MLITLFLLGCLTGIPIGWFASRKNTVILTEQSINEGLELSKKAAIKRMEKMEQMFKDGVKDLMASTRTQLENKLGLDNPDPTPHTNGEVDDGVNISREARTL